MPRGGGIHRVARYRPRPSPRFQQPPVHMPPVQREIRRWDSRQWQPGSQIYLCNRYGTTFDVTFNGKTTVRLAEKCRPYFDLQICSLFFRDFDRLTLKMV